MISLQSFLMALFIAGQIHCFSPQPSSRQSSLDLKESSSNEQGSISRREALVAGTTATVTTMTSAWSPSPSNAVPPLVAEEGPPERQALLQAIASQASDETVADWISKLEPLDPSKGNGAAASELGGTWELIYSVNTKAFSPLLNLPQPVRPTSLQLLGDAAAKEVGNGRVAQVLNFPLIPLSLVLSSGALPVKKDLSTLEIFPPFRLEMVWGDDALRRPGLPKGGSRVQLVESGSDADFRALNARDDEAQAAGRNMYKQRYLEVTGQAGDLRISEIVSGDPVIVGAVFVHQRL